ncbi:uncharacterized protein LOC125430772 [Sphaerodactylus townsendi]|uniref:uncharacterized protein LOC125430772 n=1 Tax=Sphaerodactylus townsendi TaxID=933632 RepID=UPI002025B7F2|nr:uncharacterized protein LOC125430772 [Sphaerodactylus townsendi]
MCNCTPPAVFRVRRPSQWPRLTSASIGRGVGPPLLIGCGGGGAGLWGAVKAEVLSVEPVSGGGASAGPAGWRGASSWRERRGFWPVGWPAFGGGWGADWAETPPTSLSRPPTGGPGLVPGGRELGGGLPSHSVSLSAGSRFLRRVVWAEAGERRQGAGPESTGGAWWLCCGRGRRAGSSMVGESRMFLWNRGQQPLPPKEPFGPVFHSPEDLPSRRGGFLQFAPSPFLEGDTQFGPSDLQATRSHSIRVKAACGSRAAGCRPLL